MRIWSCGFVVLALFVGTAAAHEWTDASGDKHLKADFVALTNETVHLRLPGGQVGMIKLDQLSEADQAYAQEQAAATVIPNPAKPRAAAMPSAPAQEPSTANAAVAAKTSANSETTERTGRTSSTEVVAAEPSPTTLKRIYWCHGLDIHLLNGSGTADWYWGGFEFLEELKFNSTIVIFTVSYRVYSVVGKPGVTWYIAENEYYHCYPVWRIEPSGSAPLLYWAATVRYPF